MNRSVGAWRRAGKCGAAAVEVALILVLIAVASIFVVGNVGSRLQADYCKISAALGSAANTCYASGTAGASTNNGNPNGGDGQGIGNGNQKH